MQKASDLFARPLEKLVAAAIEGDQEAQDEILIRHDKGLIEEGKEGILDPLSWKRQKTQDLA